VIFPSRGWPTPGFISIQGCARGSHRLQKSATALGKASRKRVELSSWPIEGALGRSGASPLTGRRAKAILVLARIGDRSRILLIDRGSATGSVRGRVTTLDPAEEAGYKGALLGGPLIRGPSGPGGAEFSGKPGTIVNRAEAGGSPSSEAPLDHVSVEVTAGRMRGSRHRPRKRGMGVIRESSDRGSARGVGRLQRLGRRIFPSGRAR
jgi:hypothetical protein